MEALGRVELPTNGLGNRCSIHLSYRAMQWKSLTSVQFTPTDQPILGSSLRNQTAVIE